jgi:hypothetical protein
MSKLRATNPKEGARNAALKVLARFEASGPMSPADRGLVVRFRSDDYGDHLGSAWLKFEKVMLRPEDGYVLFADIFAVWHHAMEASSIPVAYAGRLKDFVRAKSCTDYLIALNQSGCFEAEGSDTIEKLDQAHRSLEWLGSVYGGQSRRGLRGAYRSLRAGRLDGTNARSAE